ncbi:MAG: hypothetical protein CL609_00635 [Anaerolineaceae bacterium]|nr:hypothetical protein [Anaerolineaceae bacterium]
MIRSSDIVRLIHHHFPKAEVHSIEDRGTWVRRIFYVTMKNGGRLVVKFHVVKDWLDSTIHEKMVSDILKASKMPYEQILVADASGKLIEYPYLILVAGRGKRLDLLMKELTQEEMLPVYEAVGRYYAQLHQIRGPQSGVWLENPLEVFPTSPTEYMLENEIRHGSTEQMVQSGLIAEIQQQRMVELWEKNIDFLQDHTPVMVHSSPFPWAIYLEKNETNFWQVSRTSALGDTMWWDAAYDLSFLIHPPFTWMFDDWRDAFWQGYGQRADAGRLMLYRLLQIPCAINDVYMQPDSEQNEAWKQHALDELPQLIVALENRF